MTAVPFIPETAPFSPEQRAWLNGFFAGMFSRTPAGNITPMPPAQSTLTPLTVLFGSQTGTAEGLAKRIAKEAGRRGFAATVLDLAQTDFAKLAAEKNVIVVTSTYGEGEPPDNAKALHTDVMAAVQKAGTSPALANLRFSVCALGDTNYVHFCRCGQDFDLAFEKLGATRVHARADCDLDYETPFCTWLNGTLSAFSALTAKDTLPVSAPMPHTEPPAEVAPPSHSRQRPFSALLLTSRNLNTPGSAKQVHHVEFDLADSGLTYEAGDALGVYPHNCPALVTDVLMALACDGEEAVPAPDGTTTSLRRALTELYDLGKPSPELLSLLAPALVGRDTSGPGSTTPHHVLDVLLARADVRIPPPDFVRVLKKLQPRLYSISSSPRAHPGQVHLTVGAVRYELQGRGRTGVCSTFLADRAVPGSSHVGIFFHPNKAFRPPTSGDMPMIMVGPGTGIAPFRAFLHERKAAGAKGRNWLFFGDQCAATDFLYRDELKALQQEGILTRLDTAFSRDQTEKFYVQHRMLEQAQELFSWLEAGASFYVCGDASKMARDVDAALHRVIEKAGGMTPEEAASYVQAMRAANRYARDVY